MDRLELLKNDGYWSSKLNTMLYHKNYTGRERRQELLKEIIKLKNELIELCECEGEDPTSEQLEHDALLAIGRKCTHIVCTEDECPFVMNDDIKCPLH